MEINLKIISLIILVPLFSIGCSIKEKSKSTILIEDLKDKVMIKIDSISYPETAFFAISVRLINSTNKKIILFFDSAHNNESVRFNTFYLKAGNKYFPLRIRDRFLVFAENATGRFIAEGRFHLGQGSFNSFKEIDSSFAKGELIFISDDKIQPYIEQSKLGDEGDTLVIPKRLKSSTKNAVIGYNPLSL